MKITKFTMKLLCGVAVAAACFLPVREANAQAYTAIPLGFGVLTSNTNAALLTNLTAGVESVVSYTNTSTLWSNSIAALVSYTNVTLVTNAVYSDFSAKGQDYVPIHQEWTCSAGASNIIVYVGRSGTGAAFNTNLTASSTTIITNALAGKTRIVRDDLVDMKGYEFGRILYVKWDSLGNGDTLTNISFVKGNKLNPGK
jgi:hypothetical protein